jgi:nitric oxide dioxygenase
MENKWQNLYQRIEYPKNGVLSKVIIKSDNLDSTLFCMASRTEISEHTSTKNGLVLVLEGEGLFNLKGKDIIMKPGVLIYMEKNAAHSLKAMKNTSFLLVLFNN